MRSLSPSSRPCLLRGDALVARAHTFAYQPLRLQRRGEAGQASVVSSSDGEAGGLQDLSSRHVVKPVAPWHSLASLPSAAVSSWVLTAVAALREAPNAASPLVLNLWFPAIRGSGFSPTGLFRFRTYRCS